MRLATWNTLWRFGDWEPRQALLAAHLVDLAPDVLLLQETWPAQAKALAQACGLRVLGFSGGFFDQTLSSVPVDAEFGNAILAQSGDIELDELLPAPGDPAPRRLLAARVDGGRVATSHLTHMGDAGPQRAAQLARVVELLRGGSDEPEPFVFGGDCNLLPHSPEHAVGLELGLRDLWQQFHPEDHGATMVPANPEIAEVEWMDVRNGVHAPPGTGVRLDYLWAFGDDRCVSIDQFGRGDTSSPTSRWASDHLGLVADFD